MTIPVGPVPVPEIVTRIAEGRAVLPVWINELGGVTFRLGTGEEYVKASPTDLAGEAQRLTWAGQFAAVPRVLGVGDGWLHTAGLPGSSAVDPRWVADPRQAARAIGSGLRVLHERLPVDDCPFEWPVSAGRTDVPSPDRLVVCHGDACAPNTLIGDDGRCCGHVDLDQLGVADRWADLAVATMSLGWNYPGTWEDELFEAYGVEPDPVRIGYYRRLWNGDLPGSG
jgi:kanamycin kinase